MLDVAFGKGGAYEVENGSRAAADSSYSNQTTKVFSQYYPGTYCYDMPQNIPCIEGAELWYSRLKRIDVTAILMLEASILGVTIKRSKVPHPDSGFDCLETRRLEESEVVGC